MARSPKKTGPEEPDEDTPPMPAEDSTVLEQETPVVDETEELAGEQLCFHVGTNIKLRRLDQYLSGRFSHFSRTRLQKLIKEQGVNVNGRPAKPSHKLSSGDQIDIILPPRELRELIPEDIPLDILYEDDDIAVINKQANLIVHPARGYKSGTLVNALVYHYKNTLSTGTEDFRPGIVHRLDRNTTGVIITVKTDSAHWKISRQFAQRTTKKNYLAIVHGVPELDADCIDVPLGIHPIFREKYAVRHDIGKSAITFYKVVEKFRGYALVELDIKTGRTHQIRVHLAHIGHPIVADDLYGGRVVYPWQIEDRKAAAEEPLMARPALHAWKLEVEHPTTRKRVLFTAPPAKDMQNFLKQLRLFRKL
jgi:23S rRNA pseudouridine1911/1915/1917 synthase